MRRNRVAVARLQRAALVGRWHAGRRSCGCSGPASCASALALAFACAAACAANAAPLDEAQRAGRTDASFPQASEDYFHDMDNGVALTPDEVKGRNMWIVWTGGNDRFWDRVVTEQHGDLRPPQDRHLPSEPDLLRRPALRPRLALDIGSARSTSRASRSRPAPTPSTSASGSTSATPSCAADPFEDATKYPGVKIGARGMTYKDGSTLPVGSYFGEATGILGLRLFPNPDFDQAAKDKWDPERYYTDPNYYNDPKLVRPYRVGMSCGFCHVGPSPIHPPADPAHPQWSNLNSTVGAQYLWMDRVFVWSADEKNFLYQLVHSYPPGTMDTSLVSTDYINNPRTMNAIYLLGPRLAKARSGARRRSTGGQLNNRQLRGFFDKPKHVMVAARPEGRRGFGRRHGRAEPRLYQHRPLQRGLDDPLQSVLRLQADQPDPDRRPPRRNSAYWRATEAGTPFMAQFLLRAGQPDKLADAPGGDKYLTADADTLARGKRVFAETCARCHSSKLPEEARAMMQPAAAPAQTT